MPVKKKAATKKPKLKKTDYMMNYGTLKIDFVRGVQIDGKTSNLSVQLSLNYKKDLFSVQPKLDNDQVTNDSALNKATLDTLQELTNEAMLHGIEWRTERKKLKEENSDPDQIKMSL